MAGSLTSAGVIGFVGLLVAGSFMPDEAEFLRISAFAWFFVFGAVRMALSQILAKRGRAEVKGQLAHPNPNFGEPPEPAVPFAGKQMPGNRSERRE